MLVVKKTAFLWLIALLFVPFFTVAQSGQAALFLNPASGSFLVGSTFDLSIVLDTKGQAVNTVEIELLFPPDRIQLTSPSVGKSIIQVWPAPPSFSNREGVIYFVGGIPSPGIVTSQGIVLTLTFRVVGPGEGQIKFGDRTQVLANDGKGTDILRQKGAAFLRFSVPPPQGPEIFSPTHPDQEKWYRDPNPVFVWGRSQFANGFSYEIDRDPSGFPDTISDGQESTVAYENLENGMWYFHLRERSGGVWGGVSHYIIKIDQEPPAFFRVNVSPGLRTINKNPIFRFFTTDALSGLDHFEMKVIPLSQGLVSESLFFDVTSPYQAPNFERGRHQVIIRAVDQAGNTRDEAVVMTIIGATSRIFTPEGIDLIFFFIPWVWALLWLVLLLILILILFGYLWAKHRHHVRHAFREDFGKIFGGFKKSDDNNKKDDNKTKNNINQLP